jgi:hypothetical protein
VTELILQLKEAAVGLEAMRSSYDHAVGRIELENQIAATAPAPIIQARQRGYNESVRIVIAYERATEHAIGLRQIARRHLNNPLLPKRVSDALQDAVSQIPVATMHVRSIAEHVGPATDRLAAWPGVAGEDNEERDLGSS